MLHDLFYVTHLKSKGITYGKIAWNCNYGIYLAIQQSAQQSITDIFVAINNNCTQHSFHSQTILIVEPTVSTNHKITTGSRFHITT